MSISLLNQTQKNAYVQNLFGPPLGFTRASAWSGLARQASGLTPVTLTRAHVASRSTLQASRFRYASSF
jgi:hypothetical protein